MSMNQGPTVRESVQSLPGRFNHFESKVQSVQAEEDSVMISENEFEESINPYDGSPPRIAPAKYEDAVFLEI
jgi:uncharacterized protein YfdQ (DUF2303 family)